MTDQSRVEEAVERLLSEVDPKTVDAATFRGARYDHGLAWVHFPEGLGGLGAPPQMQAIVEQRVRAAGASGLHPNQFFIALAAPTIITHGTDEQKRRLLRPMYVGEHIWCQLFSEPGAGSDLAGLSTSAVRDGDEWVVNGQKVWTTVAHLANWGLLVTRTDPQLPKHKGMTFFVVEMDSPGVEVRPLRQMTGEAEFNEVYLTDVRIPDTNRVGEVNDGWRVALTTLANERVSIGASREPKRDAGPISELLRVWAELPEERKDAVARQRVAELWSRAELLRLTNIRAKQNRKAGNPGPESAVAKLALSSINRDVFELAVDLLGPAGQVDYDYAFRRPDTMLSANWGDARSGFLRVRAGTIEGGTSEILRNIMGEQVLGLPGEPRVDKDRPWAEVPRG